MSCLYTARLSAALCLALLLAFAVPQPAEATPTRNRIGNTSNVLANVDVIYNICLQHCVQSSEYRMALESCEHSCAELRREFPLRDKGYSSYENCAKAVDDFDLNRDVLEKKAAGWCAETWTHIHKRQGCREGTAAFYAAVTQENICMRQPSGYTIAREPSAAAQRPATPGVTPLTPVGAQEYAAPAGTQGYAAPVVAPPLSYPQNQPIQAAPPAMSQYPDQTAAVAADTTVVLPARQAYAGAVAQPSYSGAGGQYPVSTGGLVGAPGGDPVFVFGPTLTDTPKYQTPEEVARTQRRSRGGSGKPAATATQGAKQAQSKAAAPKAGTAAPAVPPAAAPPVGTAQSLPTEKDAPMPEAQQPVPPPMPQAGTAPAAVPQVNAAPASTPVKEISPPQGPVSQNPAAQTGAAVGSEQAAPPQASALQPEPPQQQAAPQAQTATRQQAGAAAQTAESPPSAAPASGTGAANGVSGAQNAATPPQASPGRTAGGNAEETRGQAATQQANGEPGGTPPQAQFFTWPSQQPDNIFPGPAAPVVVAPTAPNIAAPTAPGIQAPAAPLVAAPTAPQVAAPQVPARTAAPVAERVEDLPAVDIPRLDDLPDVEIAQPALPDMPPAPGPVGPMEQAVIHDGRPMAPAEVVAVPQPGASAAPVVPSVTVPDAPTAFVAPVGSPEAAPVQQGTATSLPADTNPAATRVSTSVAPATPDTPDATASGTETPAVASPTAIAPMSGQNENPASPPGPSLEDALRIPEGPDASGNGGGNQGATGVLPPTPSMLKQPVETPVTLQPGTAQ